MSVSSKTLGDRRIHRRSSGTESVRLDTIVKDACAQGYSYADIARAVGLVPTAIQNRAKRLGVDRGPDRPTEPLVTPAWKDEEQPLPYRPPAYLSSGTRKQILSAALDIKRASESMGDVHIDNKLAFDVLHASAVDDAEWLDALGEDLRVIEETAGRLRQILTDRDAQMAAMRNSLPRS